MKLFINSPYQDTPLHKAAGGGHVDTVRCLVVKGAHTCIKDENEVSNTILLIAEGIKG